MPSAVSSDRCAWITERLRWIFPKPDRTDSDSRTVDTSVEASSKKKLPWARGVSSTEYWVTGEKGCRLSTSVSALSATPPLRLDAADAPTLLDERRGVRLSKLLATLASDGSRKLIRESTRERLLGAAL